MARPRHAWWIPSALVTAVTVAACGGDSGSSDSAAPAAGGGDRVAPAAAPPRATRTAGRCRSRAVARPVGRVTTAAQSRLARAVRETTERGGRFATTGTVTFGERGLTLRAELRGRRTSTGASTATLRWLGATGILLPDARLRIVHDELALRSGAAPWRDLGSASGIALDVGRELRTHQFLLRDTSSSTFAGTTTIASSAVAEELRDYAGSERHGLATDLLVNARSLRITTVVERHRVVADTFTLNTRVPPGLADGVPSGPVVVRGTTAYC